MTADPDPDEERNRVAKIQLKRKETFELVAPLACSVQLVGDFTSWQDNPVELKRQKDGVWRATVSLDPGPHEYRFVVDGQWHDDTRCGVRSPNPFGGQNCIREVAA
jgi:1,4-alpha-glucan branching enzyme